MYFENIPVLLQKSWPSSPLISVITAPEGYLIDSGKEPYTNKKKSEDNELIYIFRSQDN